MSAPESPKPVAGTKPTVELTRPRRPIPRRRRGTLTLMVVLLIAIGLGLWWQWPRAVTEGRPSAPAGGGAPEQPLPTADPEHFTVVVAHLDNDAGDRQRRLIVDALRQLGEARMVEVDRAIQPTDAASVATATSGHDAARRLLAQSGAHALIWGAVGREGDRSAMIYWTLSAALQNGGRWGHQQPPGDLALPAIGWNDLADLLRLLVVGHAAEFGGAAAAPGAEQFSPVLDKVRSVAYTRAPRPGMSKPARTEVQFILAYVLAVYGEQTGQLKLLQEAVTLYRELLAARRPDGEPLPWVMAQNNLGNALRLIGEREAELPSQRAYFERAVSAYQDALQELSRDRAPLSWAMLQSNLAGALTSLGLRAAGTARLEAAVAAYRDALAERTRDRTPLAWAMTQITLGDVLREFGRRSEDGAALCEAVDRHLLAWEFFSGRAPAHPVPLSAAAAAVEKDIAILQGAFEPRVVQDCLAQHDQRFQRLHGGSPR